MESSPTKQQRFPYASSPFAFFIISHTERDRLFLPRLQWSERKDLTFAISQKNAGEVACRYDCKPELTSKNIALTYDTMEKCRREHCKCRYNCYYKYFHRGMIYQYEKCARACPDPK
ncbi:Hypothetical predicted protein [Octopus vulgaris]|uniref:Uncharacterized protein n=1 Tax=Octopus vulgaris TaxID=6645 RepID=A0AA36F004_OCTVU|nr:Hypothetical predicted protein [Octopus vulgaris]